MNYYQKNLFLYIIPLCILVAIVLTSIQMLCVKNQLLDGFKGMEFVIESDSHFKANLFYTYGHKFDSSKKLDNLNDSSDTLLFYFPKSKNLIKKFRLDFGNNPKINSVKIRELRLLFKGKTLLLNEKEVFNSLYKNFSAVSLDKKNQIIHFNKKAKPFDPYIIFLPLAELTLQKSLYPFVLFSPFLIFVFVILALKARQEKIRIQDILILLFIVSIPLKIAWTTFIALLMGLLALSSYFRKKQLYFKNPAFYGFIGILCFLAIFGRPTNFIAIEKQMSFLVFAIISVFVVLSQFKAYKSFVTSFLVINAIMVASGISFLIFFNDFYGLGVSDYFAEIKNYSINIRKWFYYDHAVFLSFFGLIGLLFVHKLYDNKQVQLKLLFLYHGLLVLFIFLAGARICFMIYLIFLINMLISIDYKKRLSVNLLFFVIFSFVLTLYISRVDSNRHHLWAVSWEAIKEKPVFGYGLDQSNSILNDTRFINRAGFSKPLDLNHSHNQYITFLLETGIVGFSFFVIGLVYFLAKSKLYKDDTVVLFLLGLGYLCLTESVLETSKPLYVICFLFLIITTKNIEHVEKNKA